MASVERATAKAAAALLPGLLPTPPRSTMPCVIVIPPATPNPKHPMSGRAHSVQRWDAHKNLRPRSSASSCGSTSPGRADSCARWDINKKIIISSGSASSSSSSQGSSSSKNPGRASSCEKWDSGKRPPSRGASSAGRWDAHKKPRAAESEQEKEQEISKEPKEEEDPVFSGPSFFITSPEPSMLPMPVFFPRRAGMIPVPAILQAH